MKVLSIGSTGSVGILVVQEALRQGHTVRALVRDETKATVLPEDVEVVIGDLTIPATLADVVMGVDAIIFTHGRDGGGPLGAENIDYGGVRNILMALGSSKPHIALMTSIGVTNRDGMYNRSTKVHDWKRRAERLVRAGEYPYTIVRPGWFDYNKEDELHLHFLQGDTRKAGNSSDGVIARKQIAQVLVDSLTLKEAKRKTFELVATEGAAQTDRHKLFAALEADSDRSFDGVQDIPNQPLDQEPFRVLQDLQTISQRASRLEKLI